MRRQESSNQSSDQSSTKRIRLTCRTCALSGICRSCANECHSGHYTVATSSPLNTVNTIECNACQCSAGASCHFMKEESLSVGGNISARRAIETLQLYFVSQHYNKSSSDWLTMATDDRGFVSVLKCIAFMGEVVGCEELAREAARSPFFRSIHVSTKRAMISCVHPRAPDVVLKLISHLPKEEVIIESPLGSLPLDLVLFPNVLNILRGMDTNSIIGIEAKMSSLLCDSTSNTGTTNFISTAKDLRSFITNCILEKNVVSQESLLVDKVSVMFYFTQRTRMEKATNTNATSFFRGIVHYIALSTRTDSALIDIQALICEDSNSDAAKADSSLRIGTEAIVEYLSSVFLNIRIVKVLYNGGIDLIIIQRELGLFFVNVFDVYTAIDEILLYRNEHEIVQNLIEVVSTVPTLNRRNQNDSSIDSTITTSLVLKHSSNNPTREHPAYDLAKKLALFSNFIVIFLESSSLSNSTPKQDSIDSILNVDEWIKRPMSNSTQLKLLSNAKNLLRAGVAVWSLLDSFRGNSSTPLVQNLEQDVKRFADMLLPKELMNQKSSFQKTLFDKTLVRSQLSTLRSPPVNAFHGEHGSPLTIPSWYVKCSFCHQVGSHFSVDCETPTTM